MLQKTLKESQRGYSALIEVAPGETDPATRPTRHWPTGLLLCALGLVLCILLTVTPLIRTPDTVIRLHIALGSLLATVSNWLPASLSVLDQSATASFEFYSLIVLAFLCYLLGAVLIRHQLTDKNQSLIRWIIWLTALLVGAIYVVTPAMLSHDILVYASYSRVLATYHANPYFVPIANFSSDPFTPINYWSKTITAYGPIWTLICGFWGWLLSPDPNLYVLCFRIFALAIHLLNIWLVGRTLKTMGRSPRTVTLGMLLYGWNPLVLLESGLGGHNDVLMMTFVLTGILLAAHAENNGQFLKARGYLPPTLALTLAVLIKFTALPILAAYLLFLACKALRPSAQSTRDWRQASKNWLVPLCLLIRAVLVAGVVALLFYEPFWFGHGLKEIIASFQNPPSAQGAENSFMRSISDWRLFHPSWNQSLALAFLTNRHLWDDFNYLVIAGCLIVGARFLWRQPTTKTFVLVALLTMSAVLLITPWFYPWYITWLIGMAVVCLPMREKRAEAALLTLALAFSLSALWTYPFSNGLFGSHYYLVSLFTTIPPVCAFVIVLLSWQSKRKRITEKREP
jgi:uncharacterized membrane protein